jgi:hypothetical protein
MTIWMKYQIFTQFDKNVELLKKGKQAAFANPVVNALLFVSLTICYVKELMTKHKSSCFQTVLLKLLRFRGRAGDFFSSSKCQDWLWHPTILLLSGHRE